SPEWQGAYMVLSSRAWHPLVDGHSGFDPAGPYLRGVFSRFPDADSLRLLADLKVGLVIVHDDLRPGPICLRLEFRPMPYLSETWSGQKTCILRVLGAPPAPPTPPEELGALAGARLTGAAGDSAAAAAGGDLATPVASTAHLRVVRPARTKDSPVDLFSNWLHWGVHEVELYEAADS